MALTITEQQVREQLGAFLTKPLEVTSGTLSTQQNVSATSLSTGGLTGKFIIRETGEIVVIDKDGNEIIRIDKNGMSISEGTSEFIRIDKTGITVFDSTTDRVKIGDLS